MSRPSLAEAFSDLRSPATDVAPSPGAVDIRRITPTRTRTGAAASPDKAKSAIPSHPSRIWVQVATGRDPAALAYDWRRLGRDAGEALRGKQAFVSAWGQTNRLLTGPFQTEAAANAFILQLRRAAVNGPFVWTSPAGQVVDALSRK